MASLAIAVLASAPNASAQSLPGPAADGWFVVIGQSPYAETIWPEKYCMAFITSAAFVDAKTWSGVDSHFDPQKKFGPFESTGEASAALRKSGWQFDQNLKTWFAASGCQIDHSKIRNSQAPAPVVELSRSVLSAAEAQQIHDKIRPCVNLVGQTLGNGSSNGTSICLRLRQWRCVQMKQNGLLHRRPFLQFATAKASACSFCVASGDIRACSTDRS